MAGWLDGDVALITGGGSGLGRALVDRFRAEGAQVSVLERSASKAEALLAEFDGEVPVTVGDVRSLADNASAVEATLAAFGRLDCFVGNAGIWDWSIPLLETPSDALSDTFDEVVGVNLKGLVLGARVAAGPLRETNGSMVFTLSNAAFYPGGGGVCYTASKHAVIGLVRQLAYELAPDVRVNGVAVGGMGTDLRGPESLGMQDRSLGDMVAQTGAALAEWAPLGRLFEPEDYTGHYVLLASRANGGCASGYVHQADGGSGIRGRKEAELRRKLIGSSSGRLAGSEGE